MAFRNTPRFFKWFLVSAFYFGLLSVDNNCLEVSNRIVHSFVVCPMCALNLAHNVFGLCVRAGFGAQNCQPALNLNRSTKLQVCTSPRLTQNPCYSQFFYSLVNITIVLFFVSAQIFSVGILVCIFNVSSFLVMLKFITV
jgi:hypothetical protein